MERKKKQNKFLKVYICKFLTCWQGWKDVFQYVLLIINTQKILEYPNYSTPTNLRIWHLLDLPCSKAGSKNTWTKQIGLNGLKKEMEEGP